MTLISVVEFNSTASNNIQRIKMKNKFNTFFILLLYDSYLTDVIWLIVLFQFYIYYTSDEGLVACKLHLTLQLSRISTPLHYEDLDDEYILSWSIVQYH